MIIDDLLLVRQLDLQAVDLVQQLFNLHVSLSELLLVDLRLRGCKVWSVWVYQVVILALTAQITMGSGVVGQQLNVTPTWRSGIVIRRLNVPAALPIQIARRLLLLLLVFRLIDICR